MTVFQFKKGISMQKALSTDRPFAPMPRVVTTPEEARAAALSSVTNHCGWCAATWPEGDTETARKHRCRDAAGRDLEPVKRASMEGARRELAALKRFPIPPCQVCGKEDMRPGESHMCVLGQMSSMPHDAAAAAFQRQGMAALAAEIAKKEDPPDA